MITLEYLDPIYSSYSPILAPPSGLLSMIVSAPFAYLWEDSLDNNVE